MKKSLSAMLADGLFFLENLLNSYFVVLNIQLANKKSQKQSVSFISLVMLKHLMKMITFS